MPWLFTINDFQSLKEGYMKGGTEAIFLRGEEEEEEEGGGGVVLLAWSSNQSRRTATEEPTSSKLPPATLTSTAHSPIRFCYNQYFWAHNCPHRE